MRKDPTEFRERFKKWQSGEKVYEAGLPKFEGGEESVRVGDYNVYPSAIGASELNVTTPEVVVTGKDRRPAYQRYDAEHSTYDPNTIRNFTDWIPVVGDIGTGIDIKNAIQNNNYLEASALGAMMVLPDPIAKGAKKMFRPISKKVKRLFLNVDFTSKNAAKITPEQWTAAQDAAIARGDMAEAQRLRDLHFMAKTPNNKITSKLYHGTDATWTEYNPGFFSSGSGDQGVFGKGLYLSQYPEVSKRYGKNMMELYAYSKNPYTADRGFELFDDAAYAFNRYENSEKLFPVLKGKDAVTSPRMVMEGGWKFHYEPNEEVVIPRGEQIKSADAVTYDNKGVRIPLGKRDNFNINDIRYGIIPLISGSTGYGLYNKYAE